MERTTRREALAVFAAEVAVVLVVDGLLPRSIRDRSQGDYTTYYRPVADRLLAGHGLAHGAPDGGPALRYPPGQPGVIAATLRVGRGLGMGDGMSQALVTAVAMGLAAVCVWALARRAFGRRPALLAAGLWLVYPPNLFLATRLNSEVTFMPLAFGAVLLVMLRPGRTGPGRSLGLAAGAGALLGLALLVRPIGIAFVVPLAVAVGIGGGRRQVAWGSVSALLGAAALVVAPWIGWASHTDRAFVPLSTGGPPSVVDGLTFGLPGKGTGRTWRPAAAVSAMRDAAERARAPHPPSTVHLVTAVAGDHPGGFAELVALKVGRSWWGTESWRDEWLVGLGQVPFVVLIGWGLARARPLAGGSSGRRLAGTVLGILVATWLMTVTVLSIAAYMSPAVGLALTVAGVGPADRLARRPSTTSR